MNPEAQKAWLGGAPLFLGDLTLEASRDSVRIAIRCPDKISSLCDRLAAQMRDHLMPVVETVFIPFQELFPDGWTPLCTIPIFCRMLDDGDIGWGIGFPDDPVQMMLFSDQILNFASDAKLTFENWIEVTA